METLKSLVERTIHMNPQGFTLDLSTGRLVRFGYIVAYEETQDSYGDDGLKRCLHHAFAHDWVIGMWVNDKGERQYDSCKVFRSKSKAIEFGRLNNQIAIWDSLNAQSIYL